MIKARNLYLLVLAVALAAVIISANSSYAQNEKFRAKLGGDNTTSKAVINFKTKNNMMTYKMNVTGLTDATGANLKLGKIGEGNDVVVDLLKISKQKDTATGKLIRGNITDESLMGSMSGKTLADLRTAMANNDTYISVATSAHPDGELAGLIKAKASNATSGSSSTLGSTDQTDSNTTTITETGNASTLTNNKENTVSSSEGARISIVEGASLPDMSKSFEPASITVSTGTTVTWTNDDTTLHTIISGTPEGVDSGKVFDSSYLKAGRTFEHKFDTAGTFDYYCTLHPFMMGTVVVK
jgi:plastocyanin